MGNKFSVPVVDLSGKVAIVTGGNTGIGYELVRGLAEMGATVIMASRSEDRATSAIAKIKENSEKDLKIEFIHLDLASFQSTKDFVRAFKEKNLPLHILINNAAVAGMLFTRTGDGMELQYQVNHLCPFLLTLELLPNVIETASSSGDGRILFVSSNGHERSMAGPVNFETINTDIDYGRMKSYSRTKLYNVMITYALQRRLQNLDITVSAQHPGLVQTEIKRGFADSKIYTYFINFAYAIGLSRTPEQGAATTLNCAVNPELNSQTALYYDSMRAVPCNPDARNIEYQEELWRRSIEDLRDHLSPEILDKYGATLSTEQPTAATEPTAATQEETTTADETTQAVQTMAETAQTSVTEGTTETEQTSSTTGETNEAMTVTTVETEQTTTANDTTDTTIGTEQTATADETEAAAETGAGDETTEATIPFEAEQTTAVVDSAEAEQTTTIESIEATTTETAAAKEGQ